MYAWQAYIVRGTVGLGIMEDLKFVRRCLRRDKQSWDEFLKRYSRLIYNYIYTVLKTKGLILTQENINDIFQNIFLALIKDNFKKLRSFKAKNGCSLASWLRQVVINYTIDYIRKLKPLVSIEEKSDDEFSLKDILTDDSDSHRDTITYEERLQHLKDCIGRLNNDDKYFLELHINRGLSLEELKDFFAISRGAIDMRKSRVIDRLRDCFRSKDFFKLDF